MTNTATGGFSIGFPVLEADLALGSTWHTSDHTCITIVGEQSPGDPYRLAIRWTWTLVSAVLVTPYDLHPVCDR